MKRLALILALGAAGCGEAATPRVVTQTATPTPGPPLSATERRAVQALEARVQTHCIAVTRSLVEPQEAPTAAEEARAFAAADELVGLVRATPTAQYGTGQDLRLFLADVVENLEGSNCDPRMTARLEAGLATIPQTP